MIVCFFLFCIEGGLTYFLLRGNLSFFGYLGAHGVLMAAAVLLTLGNSTKFKKINLYLLTILVTSVTGVLGAGMGFLASMLTLYRGTKKRPALENLGLEEETLEKADEEPQLIADLSEKDLKSKAQVIPFLEILTAGTLNEKLETVSKISQHYRPEFAPALLKAKQDENNSIRVLAASTIAKIDQKMLRRYKSLAKKYEEDPSSLVVLLNLARHASAYADCGVLDSYRESHFREKAIDFFEKYIQSRPKDHKTLLVLTKLYLKQKRPSKALTLYEVLIQQKVKLNLIDLFWYFECLYQVGKYNTIRQQMERFLKSKFEEVAPNDLFFINDILKPWTQKPSVGRGV